PVGAAVGEQARPALAGCEELLAVADWHRRRHVERGPAIEPLAEAPGDERLGQLLAELRSDRASNRAVGRTPRFEPRRIARADLGRRQAVEQRPRGRLDAEAH